MPKKTSNILFPKTSLRRKLVRKILVILHLKSPFIAGYYNTCVQQQRRFPILMDQSRDLSSGPLISIVVPAYNTPEPYLNDLIYSIISQAYQNWELILINASDESNSKMMVNECASRDPRIKVFDVENRGISANTNIGIKESTGDYVAFCDHDDVLEPFALYEVVLKIIDEKAELIYTDEDKISDDGKIYFDPHFKPDWSPDLLTHVNYINHLTVVKKKLLHDVGLLDSEVDGAQDYDLLLRLIDKNPRIAHVSKVLYHWRSVRNSTARNFSSKKNITSSGKKALEQHFKRLGLNVKAEPKEDTPGFYKLAFEKVENISLIIMPFTSDVILKLFIELLIIKTNHSSMIIELIVPEGINPKIEGDKVKVKTIKRGGDFLNSSINEASFDKAIIINQIALPKDKDWVQGLCGVLCQTHVKTVSPLIMQDEDIIDNCGLVVDCFGNYMTLFRGADCSGITNTFFGDMNWVRNADAINGGIVAVRKKRFKTFLESYDSDIHNAVFKFSESEGLYNTIYTEVVFDNYNIHLPIKKSNVAFFNSNLILSSDGYVITTPETSVINILLDIAQKEGLSL
ncbi:MAG: glycosyltransferase [Candidatus Saccharibacteria bacterium]